MFNGKLKLNNNLGKNYEIILDNNSSFEEIKSKIMEELNFTENDQIYIKFSDIKYEKNDSENPELKISLLNAKDINQNLDQNLEKLNQQKDKEIEELNNKILSLEKDIELIKTEYQNNIKTIEENYEDFKTKIIGKSKDNYNSLKEEIRELLKQISKKEDKKDKIVVDDKLNINDNKNEIILNNIDNNEQNEDEININFDNYSDDDLKDVIITGEFDDFEKFFNFSDYKINEERRRQIFYANHKQFFAASSKIIEECYKPENNISIPS